MALTRKDFSIAETEKKCKWVKSGKYETCRSTPIRPMNSCKAAEAARLPATSRSNRAMQANPAIMQWSSANRMMALLYLASDQMT